MGAIMKARIAFDTLAYANRLKAAGLDSKVAEVQAEANADMIANLLDNTLATKQDVTELAQVTRQDIAELAQTTKQDIFRVELKLAELETRLLLKLGTITVASISVATAVFSMIHHFK